MLTKELIARLETKVLETYETAQKVFNRNFELPKIEWKNMGRVAGRAFLNQNRIVYSPTLYAENVETFLNRTCPHEVAHLVTFQVFGERGHGPKWKQVMQALNVQDDSRCHSYDTSSVARTYTVRRWHYNCACKTHTVSTTVHNRILRGARYTCKRCGTGIQIG